MVYLVEVHLAGVGFELTTFVVIGTDCIGSYKSNYHTIMVSSSPKKCIAHLYELYIQVEREHFVGFFGLFRNFKTSKTAAKFH
jgi:hypothetical protein